jgi:hypothetical protein
MRVLPVFLLTGCMAFLEFVDPPTLAPERYRIEYLAENDRPEQIDEAIRAGILALGMSPEDVRALTNPSANVWRVSRSVSAEVVYEHWDANRR